MADQVEISNVGGEGGVASEATLAGLTRAIEKLAVTTGRDPKKEAAKVQRLHTRTLQEDIKSIEEKIEAQKEYTSALRSSTRAMGSLLGGITNLVAGGIGLLTSSVTQFAQTVMSGDESLSGLVQSIPVFGSVLSKFTDIIDDSFDAFQSMATSGASFGYDLGELRNSSRELRLSFGELSGFVTQNSTRLAAFGGTVDQGIRATRSLSEALGSDVRQQFTAMGLTAEELNEQLAFFQYVTRAGVRQDQIDRNNQAAAVESLTKNMLTLSKLTGKDIKQQRDEIAAAQQGMAFQMRMARLTEDQQAGIQQVLSNAATMGQDYVEAVRREFLGLPPLNEEQAILLATQGDVIRQFVGQLNEAQSIQSAADKEAFTSAQSQREQLADLLEAQISAAGSYENLLAAGSAGLGGVASTVAEQFGTTAEFVGQFLRENANGTIEFARDEFLASMEAAGNQMIPQGSELDAIAAFREGLREAREALTENLTNPLLEAISPSLAAVAGSFRDFVGQDGEGTKFQNAINIMREKIEGVVPKIERFINAFAADPEQAISDLVNDIGNFFRDAIFGKLENTRLDGTGEDIRRGGLIQSLRNGIADLFDDSGVLQALINGVGTVTNGLVTGFSEFWNSSESAQLRNDISSMFQILINTMQDTFVNSFLARKLLGIDREEVAERQSQETGTPTVDAAENFGRAVFEQLQSRGSQAGGTTGSRFTGEELEKFYESLGAEYSEIFRTQLESNRSFLDQGRRLITGLEEGIEIRELAKLASSGNASEEQLNLLREIYNAGRATGIFGEIESFSQGTKGFQDFGSGTLAMLHGTEAVIPLDSPLGQMISSINTGAAMGKSRTAQLPGLNFDSQSSSTQTTPKVEIENISTLTENLNDIKNQLVSTMNTANQGSLDSIKQLNMLMSQMLTVVREMAEDSDQIERNTRSTGSNIANGRVSTVR